MLESSSATAPRSTSGRTRRRRPEGGRRLGEAAPGLGELDAPHGARPERGVDPLAQERQQHLQLRRMRPGRRRPSAAPPPARGRARASAARRSRRTRDRRSPARARAAAPARSRAAPRRVRICALDQPARPHEAAADAAGLVFRAPRAIVLGHATPLPVWLTTVPARGRLVRGNGCRPGTTPPPRRCSPGTTARRATCPGARRPGRPRGPTPTGSGSPR